MSTIEPNSNSKTHPAETAAGHAPHVGGCCVFHNRVIYHCLACGSVIHREPDETIPMCCDRLMTKAATETVYDSDSRAEASPPLL
jgi:hypothetical protein